MNIHTIVEQTVMEFFGKKAQEMPVEDDIVSKSIEYAVNLCKKLSDGNDETFQSMWQSTFRKMKTVLNEMEL